MNFKVWWKLTNKEKAERSFILAPFCLLILLLPYEASSVFYTKYCVAGTGFMGFIIQGLKYKNKDSKDTNNND